MEIKDLTLWKVATSILAVILIASVLTSGFGLKQVLVKIPSEELANKTIDFINNNLLQPGTTVSLVKTDCEEKIGLCKITVNINDANFDSYISTDGELLFPEAIEMEKSKEEATVDQQENQQVSLEDIPKREKTDVKLFVMSYCPYGLQAQKSLLPVIDLLKDQADIKVHFVNYIMHDKKEIDENLRQYCIQEQELEKYAEYLGCFVEAGDFEKCLTQTNINQSKLNTCLTQTDKEYGVYAAYEDKESWLNGNYPVFKIDDELNKQYGIKGSPTMIINDQLVSPVRSPESFKQAICMGFETMPDQCAQTLSTKSPIPGLGLGETNFTSDALCE